MSLVINPLYHLCHAASISSGRPGWSPWVVAKLPHAVENGAAVLLRKALHAAMRKEPDSGLQILFYTIQAAQVLAHTYCCIATFVL